MQSTLQDKWERKESNVPFKPCKDLKDNNALGYILGLNKCCNEGCYYIKRYKNEAAKLQLFIQFDFGKRFTLRACCERVETLLKRTIPGSRIWRAWRNEVLWKCKLLGRDGYFIRLYPSAVDVPQGPKFNYFYQTLAQLVDGDYDSLDNFDFGEYDKFEKA